MDFSVVPAEVFGDVIGVGLVFVGKTHYCSGTPPGKNAPHTFNYPHL